MSYAEDLKTVKASLPEWKRGWDRSHLWIGLAARPLSWPVSAFLYGRGVSANQVTFATAVAGYGGLALLAGGEPRWMLAGAWALVLYNLLDCVDGNLARSRPPETPPRGKFYDQLVGNSYFLSYLALGIGLRSQTGWEPAWTVVHKGVAQTLAWKALALGGAATAAKYVMFRVRDDFWAVLGPSWEAGKERESAGYAAHTGTWYYGLYYAVTDLQSHVILLPLCLWKGWGFEFLAASAAVMVLELAAVTALYLKRAGSLR